MSNSLARKPHQQFTQEQNEQIYATVLDQFKMHHTKGSEYRSICPFCLGSNTSKFWFDTAEGNYYCFACRAKGPSAYMFQQALLAKELGYGPRHDETQRRLEEVLGVPFVQRVYPEVLDRAKKGWNPKHAQDSYSYNDEWGNELIRVFRFTDRNGNKLTPAARPCACRKNADAECEEGCHGGYIWSTKGVRRVPYRLPALIGCNVVFCVEGERNANDLARALAAYTKEHRGFPISGALTVDHVAVTTNPGGSAQWKPEYGFGEFFRGKIVVKLGDNDGPGRLHDRDVCSDVCRFALETSTLALPVGESEDISDYLKRNTVDDLLRLLPTRKIWEHPKRVDAVIAESLEVRPLLVKPSELAAKNAAEGGDWLVEGLIERGTRGLVVAPPKTGKSLLFLEMVLCLATNRSFLGVKPYGRPVKCAVISREDGPVIVHRRLQQLGASRGISLEEMDRHIVVNTEAQSSRFKIDRDADLTEMADWIMRTEVEFIVIDVLSKLHDQQENSSDDMTRVMNCFDELRRLTGAQVCVIAHTNKQGGVKGSTAIEGWGDWVVRLEQNADDDSIKTLFLKTKLSGAVVPRTIRYSQSPDLTQSRIELVEMRPVAVPASRPQLVQKSYSERSY